MNKPLVSVAWLENNLNDKNLIILDCTIPKVTDQTILLEEKTQIKGAIFFDIKNVFSATEAPFPNTVLSPKEFETKAKEFGIHQEAILVVYDDLGIYASPRVWWLFQLMGFKNCVVLDGGFPAWKANGSPIEKQQSKPLQKGNFKVDYQPEKVKFTNAVLSAVKDKKFLIADARSKGRFTGIIKEPRKEVKNGHIPNSVSLPFTELQENGLMKTREELQQIFEKINPNKKELIFSCGTGITACILALGAAISGNHKYAVYDGSWTEWGSTENLPIEN